MTQRSDQLFDGNDPLKPCRSADLKCSCLFGKLDNLHLKKANNLRMKIESFFLDSFDFLGVMNCETRLRGAVPRFTRTLM